MYSRKFPYYNLTTFFAACFFLSACNSNNDSLPLDIAELDGIAIDSSNYESVLRSGLISSERLLHGLSFSLDGLTRVDLNLFQEVQQSEQNLKSYNCPMSIGPGELGTLKITTVDSNTQEWLLKDCNVENNYDQTFTGKFLVKTIINSGNIADIDSVDRWTFDWAVTKDFSLTEFIIKQSFWSGGGENYTYNGDIVITQSSNNTTGFSSQDILESSSLTVNKITFTGLETDYTFKDLKRDAVNIYLSPDILDFDYAQLDLDFSANITDIGDINLMTDSALVFQEWSGILHGSYYGITDGSGLIDTGASAVKFVGMGIEDAGFGTDDLEIYLDPENDSTFKDPILTSWSSLGGGGGSLSLGFLAIMLLLITFTKFSQSDSRKKE